MENPDAQYDALKDLSTSRWMKALGFILVHIAALGLFTGVMPEANAVLGIAGLGVYWSGNRQMIRARRLLLDSLNANRLSPPSISSQVRSPVSACSSRGSRKKATSCIAVAANSSSRPCRRALLPLW